MENCKHQSILLARKLMWVLQTTHWSYNNTLSFWIVFPPLTSFRVLFLWKAITSSIEKVFSNDLLLFQIDQWFQIISFILGSVRLYVTISGNTWAFCIVFGVSKFIIGLALAVCWTDSFDKQYLIAGYIYMKKEEHKKQNKNINS